MSSASLSLRTRRPRTANRHSVGVAALGGGWRVSASRRRKRAPARLAIDEDVEDDSIETRRRRGAFDSRRGPVDSPRSPRAGTRGAPRGTRPYRTAPSASAGGERPPERDFFVARADARFGLVMRCERDGDDSGARRVARLEHGGSSRGGGATPPRALRRARPRRGDRFLFRTTSSGVAAEIGSSSRYILQTKKSSNASRVDAALDATAVVPAVVPVTTRRPVRRRRRRRRRRRPRRSPPALNEGEGKRRGGRVFTTSSDSDSLRSRVSAARVALLHLSVPPQPLQRLRADHVRLEPPGCGARARRPRREAPPADMSTSGARAREKNASARTSRRFGFFFCRSGDAERDSRPSLSSASARAMTASRTSRARSKSPASSASAASASRSRVGATGRAPRSRAASRRLASSRVTRRLDRRPRFVARASRRRTRSARRFETFVRLAYLAEPVHVAPLVGVERSG